MAENYEAQDSTSGAIAPMPDWRSNLWSLAEVMGDVLAHERFCNAFLVVGKGGKKFKLGIIKELLECLSKEFERRLCLRSRKNCTSQDNNEDRPVFEFLDVDADHMKLLLKFAYTHEWRWSQDVNDLDSVLSFLDVVKRFDVQSLAEKIQNDIKNTMAVPGFLTETTACLLFQQGLSHGIEILENGALGMILRSPDLVFADIENYKMLTAESFVKIVAADDLEVESEWVLLNILLEWAISNQTHSVEDPVGLQGCRDIVRPILPFIRFTNMTRDEFLTRGYHMSILDGMFLEVLKLLDERHRVGTSVDASAVVCDMPRKYRHPCRVFQNSGSSDLTGESIAFLSLTDNPGSANPSSTTECHRWIGILDETENIELATLARTTDSNLELTIDLVNDANSLMSLLRSTSNGHHHKSKLNLTVTKMADLMGRVNGHDFVFSSLPVRGFSQLNSVSFESFSGGNAQLQCLMFIAQHCSKLNKISIGNFSWRPHETVSIEEEKAAMEFLSTAHLKKVRLACGLLGQLDSLSNDLVRKFHKNGVTVYKIGFNYSSSSQCLTTVHNLREMLEEIHYFRLKNPPQQYPFPFLPQLRVLDIWCTKATLVNFVKSNTTPKLEKLTWMISASCPEVQQTIDLAPCLPLLKRLVVVVTKAEMVASVGQLFDGCKQSLQKLTCINYADVHMGKLYEDFQFIKKLRLIQQSGVTVDKVLGGNGMQSLASLWELTSLSFGYKNYQCWPVLSKWNLDMNIFTLGISKLPKLKRLVLPPMTRDTASTILLRLTLDRTNLTLVQFQTWHGKGSDGTMTLDDIHQLAARHSNVGGYVVGGVAIFPCDPARHFPY